MSTKLSNDGWEAVLLVREGSEQSHMLIRTHNGEIQGMTVLVSDGQSEAVVINLMGNIQPQHFGDVMLALDVEAPGIEDLRVAETLN